MAHKFIIQASGGRPDSLRYDVRIAFTLTPKESHGSPCHPVAFAAMKISSDSEETQEFEWDRELVFAVYWTKETGGKKQCVIRENYSPVVQTGYQTPVTINSGIAQWGPLVHHHDPNLSVGYSGNDVETIALVKRITRKALPMYLPIVAWPQSRQPNYPGSSPQLFLQAYILDDIDYEGVILDAGIPKHPLFTEPLNCDDLPDSSAWRLIEDHAGVIRLQRADVTDVLSQHREVINQHTKAGLLELGMNKLTTSFDEMKKQLDSVTKSLEDTQQRLLTMEESIHANKTELHATQTSLMSTRDEMSRLDLKLPDAAKLVSSIDRAEERLSMAESSIAKSHQELKALAGTCKELPRLDASVHHAQQQLSALNQSVSTVVDHRIPVIEAKSTNLDESIGHIQDQIFASRTASSTTRDRVDRLNCGVLAVQATADSLSASAGQDQDRLSATDESIGRLHKRIDAVEKHFGSVPESIAPPQTEGTRRHPIGTRRPLILAQGDSNGGSYSLTTFQRQMAVLDHKIPAMALKMERLEKYVVVMERRVPIVEVKVEQLDKTFGHTQDELANIRVSLDTIKESLIGLDSRFGEVERKTDQLMESREDFTCGVAESPAEDSPGLFPSWGNTVSRDLTPSGSRAE